MGRLRKHGLPLDLSSSESEREIDFENGENGLGDSDSSESSESSETGPKEVVQTCKCGSATHKRSNHKDCPLRKSKRPRKTAMSDEREVVMVDASQPSSSSSSSSNNPVQMSADTVRACKCGSTTHFRTNHRSCPLRSATQSQEDKPKIEWKRVPEPEEYFLIDEDVMVKEQIDPSVRSHLESVYQKGMSFARYKDANNWNSRLAIFRALADDLASTLFAWTNIRLQEAKLPIMTLSEFWGFLGVFSLAEMVNGGIERAYSMASRELIYKVPGCTQDSIPSLARVKDIAKHLSPKDPHDEVTGNGKYVDKSDTINGIRKFENVAFEKSRKIYGNPDIHVSIDDELVGSRSKEVQSKALSHRKADNEGIKNDAVADALFRVVLALRHKERLGYSQERAVQELLRAISKDVNEKLDGMCATADRGYSNVALWVALGSMDLSFVMIAGEHSDHPFVFENCDSSAGEPESLSNPANHIVDISPRLGRQILATKGSLQKSRNNASNTTDIVAVVFRDYNTKNNLGTNALRFVVSGLTPLSMKRVTNTLTMRKMRLPSNIDVNREVLFHPTTRTLKSNAVMMMENVLLDKTIPLTCWQRCADWFELRRFVITGTMGAKLARRFPCARKYLCQRATSSIVDDDDEDNDTAWDSASVGLKACAESLVNSWIFNRDIATDDMKTGTMNESNIVGSIKKEKWCVEVFEVGLFQHKTKRCIAVSPDGVGKVILPGVAVDDRSNSVICSFEFKTRSSPILIQKGNDIRSQFGHYFSCKVGDPIWWKAVPYVYRGQVIQQAVVLDLDYVVFIIASTTGLIYCCCVEVPEQVRQDYATALANYDCLVSWAHESLEGDKLPIVPAQYFSPSSRYLIKTHLRTWRAMRKLIMVRRIPIEPVYIIKTYAQSLYNVLKGGIDGSTQFTKVLTKKGGLKVGLFGKLALRTIKQLTANAFVTYRIVTVVREHQEDETESELPSLAKVRSLLNGVEALSEFAGLLAEEMIKYSIEINGKSVEVEDNNESPPNWGDSPFTPAQITEIMSKRPKNAPKLQKWFNQGDAKTIRLSGRHFSVPLPKKKKNKDGTMVATRPQRKCAFCSGEASYMCATCGVPLHTNRSSNLELTCHYRFHSTQTIKVPEASSSSRGNRSSRQI